MGRFWGHVDSISIKLLKFFKNVPCGIKMVDWEVSELTSSYWHTKTLHREQWSLRTKGRPVERTIDTNMGEAGRDPVCPGHMPLAEQPAGRRDITSAEALSKEQGIWAPHQAPKPGEPAQGRWARTPSALKTSRAYVREGQRASP